jgi:hypothetical protein
MDSALFYDSNFADGISLVDDHLIFFIFLYGWYGKVMDLEDVLVAESFKQIRFSQSREAFIVYHTVRVLISTLAAEICESKVRDFIA